MRGLLSPPSTYSVAIADCKEIRADHVRLFQDHIGYNARIRCAMPPPLLLGGTLIDDHEIPGQVYAHRCTVKQIS